MLPEPHYLIWFV